MKLTKLQQLLHPRRFRGMQAQTAAVVAYLLDLHGVTNPELVGLWITSDGFVLGSRSGDLGANAFLGDAAGLDENWKRLLETAGLSAKQKSEANALFKRKVHDSRPLVAGSAH